MKKCLLFLFALVLFLIFAADASACHRRHRRAQAESPPLAVVETPQTVPAKPAPATPPTIYYEQPGLSSGGCANGQCGSTGRTGFFRGRR